MSTLFCPECQNLLYPKEDRPHRKLLYACRNCTFEQEAPGPVVYSRQLIASGLLDASATTATVDLSSDPTYPRASSRPCPSCAYPEALFFQSRSKAKDATMKLYFACCNTACGYRWVEE
jgi:DNA-directed RNA polymerase II subunit RPB9